MIKFQKFYVTNGAVKAKVFYSASQNYRDVKAGMAGGLIDCVTLYAKGYGGGLGKIFPGKYANDTDIQSDYFDEGRVTFFPGDEHYTAALARAKQNQADNVAKAADRIERLAAKRANAMHDDFNWVGSRHHY